MADVRHELQHNLGCIGHRAHLPTSIEDCPHQRRKYQTARWHARGCTHLDQGWLGHHLHEQAGAELTLTVPRKVD